MKNARLLTAIAITATTFLGCATATELEIEPGKGGVIAVDPPRDPEARSKAQAIMQQNCAGKKPVVVKEGIVKVGQATTEEANSTPTTTKTTNIFTGKTRTVQGQQTSVTATTRDITEWRITYQCE